MHRTRIEGMTREDIIARIKACWSRRSAPWGSTPCMLLTGARANEDGASGQRLSDLLARLLRGPGAGLPALHGSVPLGCRTHFREWRIGFSTAGRVLCRSIAPLRRTRRRSRFCDERRRALAHKARTISCGVIHGVTAFTAGDYAAGSHRGQLPASSRGRSVRSRSFRKRRRNCRRPLRTQERAAYPLAQHHRLSEILSAIEYYSIDPAVPRFILRDELLEIACCRESAMKERLDQP